MKQQQHRHPSTSTAGHGVEGPSPRGRNAVSPEGKWVRDPLTLSFLFITRLSIIQPEHLYKLYTLQTRTADNFSNFSDLILLIADFFALL